jgi:hypothetical protein
MVVVGGETIRNGFLDELHSLGRNQQTGGHVYIIFKVDIV